MISKELKTRLDTFIDAILAIIITIMVLELPAQSWEHHANITNFFLALNFQVKCNDDNEFLIVV